MVAGKHDLLFGQQETDMPGGMTWCDKRLESPSFGHQRVPMPNTEINVKGRAETFEVGKDLHMRFRLIRWQAMMEKLLLTLVVQARLNLLPSRALGIPHGDLGAPQVANTGSLTTVVTMEMCDDHLGYIVEIQANVAQLALQAGEGFGCIHPGIDQDEAVISLYHIHMHMVQSKRQGYGQLIQPRCKLERRAVTEGFIVFAW